MAMHSVAFVAFLGRLQVANVASVECHTSIGLQRVAERLLHVSGVQDLPTTAFKK